VTFRMSPFPPFLALVRMPPKSSISDARCKWLESTGTSPTKEKLGSLSVHNNTWYVPDEGESAAKLNGGVIRPQPEQRRPGWEKRDRYSKSRNPAGDSNRYSYIQDCTDEIRRDYPLRYAHSPNKTSHAVTRQFLPRPNTERVPSPLRSIRAVNRAQQQ
jgi:hypothetical protein